MAGPPLGVTGSTARLDRRENVPKALTRQGASKSKSDFPSLVSRCQYDRAAAKSKAGADPHLTRRSSNGPGRATREEPGGNEPAQVSGRHGTHGSGRGLGRPSACGGAARPGHLRRARGLRGGRSVGDGLPRAHGQALRPEISQGQAPSRPVLRHRAARQAAGSAREQPALRRDPDARRADGHRGARRPHRLLRRQRGAERQDALRHLHPDQVAEGRPLIRRAPELGPARHHLPHRQGQDAAQGVARLLEAGVQGPVGMPPISYSVGLQFFIATVHALGGDEKNPADVDRGFEKMKELKSSIVQQPADAGAIQQLLERGDIAVVPLWDGRAHGLAAAGLPVGFNYPSKPGPVASGAGIGIAKGTKNRAAALKLIDFRFSPDAQKAFCQQMWYAPSNSTVKLDPKYAAKIAYGNEAYARLLAPNYDVVGQKLGDWTQRWTMLFTG